jgi:thiamine biosynthesis lipoprotein
MKRKQLAPIALIFALALILLIFYKPKTEYKKISGSIQGTTYHITYEDRPGRNLQPRIEQLLNKFDLSLSAYIEQSLISRINRNEPHVKLDKYFRKVYHKAEEVYHISGGAFDITVGPLVRAWGFGPGAKITADSSKIDSILQYIGMDKISLEGNTIVKQNPNIKLDVNAIAQGYSVDIVAEFMDRKGIVNYMVEIGGEVKTKGLNDKGKVWKIGIDKPIENNLVPGQNLQAVISLNNGAIATSGNYRKFYEKDGLKFTHSINPKTGYPVISKLLSATVMTSDCMTADAYATAFMIMGFEKSIILLSNQDTLNAYLIYSDENGDFKTYITPGMKKLLSNN